MALWDGGAMRVPLTHRWLARFSRQPSMKRMRICRSVNQHTSEHSSFSASPIRPSDRWIWVAMETTEHYVRGLAVSGSLLFFSFQNLFFSAKWGLERESFSSCLEGENVQSSLHTIRVCLCVCTQQTNAHSHSWCDTLLEDNCPILCVDTSVFCVFDFIWCVRVLCFWFNGVCVFCVFDLTVCVLCVWFNCVSLSLCMYLPHLRPAPGPTAECCPSCTRCPGWCRWRRGWSTGACAQMGLRDKPRRRR